MIPRKTFATFLLSRGHRSMDWPALKSQTTKVLLCDVMVLAQWVGMMWFILQIIRNKFLPFLLINVSKWYLQRSNYEKNDRIKHDPKDDGDIPDCSYCVCGLGGKMDSHDVEKLCGTCDGYEMIDQGNGNVVDCPTCVAYEMLPTKLDPTIYAPYLIKYLKRNNPK